MSVGSECLGFRFPPPRSRPRWARGKGSAKFRQRRASSLSGRLRESRRLGRRPLPPSGVTPPRCPLGGRRRGEWAHTACGCLPAAPRGAPAEERVVGQGTSCCCVSAASGSVGVCACVCAAGSTRAA